MVTFCNIRLWFRLCTPVGTFTPLFLPCMTSPVSPLTSIMDGWMDHLPLILSLWSLVSNLSCASPHPCCPCLHSSSAVCILFWHTTLPWSFQFFLSWVLGRLILSLLLLLPVLTTVSLSNAFLTSPPTPCISHLACLFCSYCSQTCLIYPPPPITKSVLLALRLLVPIYFPSTTLPDMFFGFEVGECYSMLLDPYKGDGAKYRWVICLLSLISQPGSDMVGISCEAVYEPWMRAWKHRKWGAGGTAATLKNVSVSCQNKLGLNHSWWRVTCLKNICDATASLDNPSPFLSEHC